MRTIDDIKEILRAGADKVAINSAAVSNPDLINKITDKTGRQCIVAAIIDDVAEEIECYKE